MASQIWKGDVMIAPYDALKIIGFDMELMGAMGGEMAFMQTLAHEGKIAQGLFVAAKG